MSRKSSTRRTGARALSWVWIGALVVAASALGACSDDGRRANGDSCTTAGQCLSGLCVDGVCVAAEGDAAAAPWQAPTSGGDQVSTDRFGATLVIGTTPLDAVETDRHRAIIGIDPTDLPGPTEEPP